MVNIIAGIVLIILGLLQLFRPARHYTGNPLVQPYFRPEKRGMFNILLSIVMIGFGAVLLFYPVK